MDRPRPEKPLVLVADDDAATRREAAEILEELGLRVRTASSGEDAIRAFSEEPPALILMDVCMPGVDGVETLRRIRAFPKGDRIPVLVVTGHDDMDEIRRAFEAGATDFVHKPFQWQVLGQRIRHMVRSERKSRALVQAWEEVLLATERETDLLKRLDYEVRHFVTDVLAELDVLENGPEAPGASAGSGSENVRGSARRLLGFLDEALDFSRVRSGRVRLSTRSFDPMTFVNSVADEYRARAAAKNLGLTAWVQPDDLPRVLGDERRLRHVLSQLLENAIRHTQVGEVHLSAREIGRDSAHVTLEFTVQDTGEGFDRDIADRAFDVYARGGEAGDGPGVGLGLYLASRIVKLMGDDLRLETEVGKGSTLRFALRFPIESDQAAVPPAPASGALDVLVVDDHEGTRAYVSRVLKLDGHTVREASDGADAIRQIEERRPDVVLMDVEMPTVDGLEATRRIRAAEAPGEHLPILALSSHALLEHQQQCAQAGMDGHLPKPFEPGVLARRVREVRAEAARAEIARPPRTEG